MRRETDPIEPGRVSIESPIFFDFPLLGWQTCVSPLAMGAVEGLSRVRPNGPHGPEAGTASFARAGLARNGAGRGSRSDV